MTPESRRLLDALGILERDDTSSGRWRDGVNFAASIVADYLPLIEKRAVATAITTLAEEVRKLQTYREVEGDCVTVDTVLIDAVLALIEKVTA